MAPRLMPKYPASGWRLQSPLVLSYATLRHFLQVLPRGMAPSVKPRRLGILVLVDMSPQYSSVLRLVDGFELKVNGNITPLRAQSYGGMLAPLALGVLKVP